MKYISFWANSNKKTAVFLVIVLSVLLNSIASFFGSLTAIMEYQTPDWLSWIPCIVMIFAAFSHYKYTFSYVHKKSLVIIFNTALLLAFFEGTYQTTKTWDSITTQSTGIQVVSLSASSQPPHRTLQTDQIF